MQAVTATEAGFVAVGLPVCARGAEPTDCHVSVWTAPPAGPWTRTPDQSGLAVAYTPVPSGPQTGMLDVASGPSGIVAIGYADDRAFDGLGVAVWRSSDGQAWQRVRVAPALFSARVSAVAAGEHGYVIVGDVIKKGLTAHAAAWTSPDGVTWTRAADTTAMDVGRCFDTGEEPDCGGMRAVAATADGYVAVGHVRTGPKSSAIRPAAWTSTDGRTWARSDAGMDFRGSLSGVTVGGPGLVAVGSICGSDCFGPGVGGVVATSVDGSTWDDAPVTAAAALQHVASVGARLFALGVKNQEVDPRAELQLWRSDDGVAWQRVTGFPSVPDAIAIGADLAGAPDHVVVVGTAESVKSSGADVVEDFSYASPPQ